MLRLSLPRLDEEGEEESGQAPAAPWGSVGRRSVSTSPGPSVAAQLTLVAGVTCVSRSRTRPDPSTIRELGTDETVFVHCGPLPQCAYATMTHAPGALSMAAFTRSAVCSGRTSSASDGGACLQANADATHIDVSDLDHGHCLREQAAVLLCSSVGQQTLAPCRPAELSGSGPQSNNAGHPSSLQLLQAQLSVARRWDACLAVSG